LAISFQKLTPKDLDVLLAKTTSNHSLLKTR
jgi:hypothetical protein